MSMQKLCRRMIDKTSTPAILEQHQNTISPLTTIRDPGRPNDYPGGVCGLGYALAYLNIVADEV